MSSPFEQNRRPAYQRPADGYVSRRFSLDAELRLPIASLARVTVRLTARRHQRQGDIEMNNEATTSAAKPGAFAPFGYSAFALLWSATLISNIGTWMHDVMRQAPMTTSNSSPAVVT